MKIRPLGAELHAERRTGVPKLVVLFHNFTNAPNPPPLFLHLGVSYAVWHTLVAMATTVTG